MIRNYRLDAIQKDIPKDKQIPLSFSKNTWPFALKHAKDSSREQRLFCLRASTTLNIPQRTIARKRSLLSFFERSEARLGDRGGKWLSDCMVTVSCYYFRVIRWWFGDKSCEGRYVNARTILPFPLQCVAEFWVSFIAEFIQFFNISGRN